MGWAAFAPTGPSTAPRTARPVAAQLDDLGLVQRHWRSRTGAVFQVLPLLALPPLASTKLGALSLTEARTRAKRGLPTDGDLAIAARLFSPPARRYTVFVDGQDQDDADTVKPLARQSEIEHQLMSVLVHALAPVGFAGYLVAALRAGEGADRALRRSLTVQAAAQLGSFIGIGSLSLATGSASPLVVYLLSSIYWLSPLNPNSLWTSPSHLQSGVLSTYRLLLHARWASRQAA